jgi:hypothetical protein
MSDYPACFGVGSLDATKLMDGKLADQQRPSVYSADVQEMKRTKRRQKRVQRPACRIATSRGEGFDIYRSSSRYNGRSGVALNCDDRVGVTEPDCSSLLWEAASCQ